VPGGRIRKNERICDALERIANSELGVDVLNSKLLGVFDHFYEDNVFAIPGFGTQYVVLGYQLDIFGAVSFVRDSQHAELKWWTIDALLVSDEVHPNTKLYFSEGPGANNAVS